MFALRPVVTRRTTQRFNPGTPRDLPALGPNCNRRGSGGALNCVMAGSRSADTAMEATKVLRVVPAALIMLLCCHGGAHAFSWDSAKSAQALQLVKEFQAQYRVPSLAVSVTLDRKTVVSIDLRADGSVVPSDEPRARYRIGSVSKQFTAAAVLALIEDEARVPTNNSPLRLKTVLSDIYPDAAPAGSDLGRITVGQLLTMTSTLPSYT